MRSHFGTESRPEFAAPNPWAHNPSRTGWWVGGILLGGAVVAAGAYVLARRQATAPSPLPSDIGVQEVYPEGVSPPADFGDFPQGAASSVAHTYFDEHRQALRRLMFRFLDQHASAKDIRGGWTGPKRETAGPPFRFDAPDGDDQPLGIAPVPLPPETGPDHWSQDEVWAIATTVMEGAVAPLGLEAYPSISDWAAIVSEDGPPAAWLQGIIAAELMRLTNASPSAVDGEFIDWGAFLPGAS